MDFIAGIEVIVLLALFCTLSLASLVCLIVDRIKESRKEKKNLKQLKQERDEGVMGVVEKLYDKSSKEKFVFFSNRRECGGWVINFGEKWDAMSEGER